MQSDFYALFDGEAWAIMSHDIDDPNPPIIVFDRVEVANEYLRGIAEVVAKDRNWKVIPIDWDEIEFQVEDSNDRIMLCTRADGDVVTKAEVTFQQLIQHFNERN